MAKESLGENLGQQYEQVKGGLKNLAQKFTEEDSGPRTDAMAGRRRGAGAVDRTASMTKEQLYADARRLGVKGRSKMTKDELAKAVRGR